MWRKARMELSELITYISKGKDGSYFIHTAAFLRSPGFSGCSKLLSLIY